MTEPASHQQSEASGPPDGPHSPTSGPVDPPADRSHPPSVPDGWVPDMRAVSREIARYLPADRSPAVPPSNLPMLPALPDHVGPGHHPPDGTGLVPVDPPKPPRPPIIDLARTANRRPILPVWARSWTTFHAAALWLTGHYTHTVAFHGVRLPAYVGRLAGRAPRGLGRILARSVGWLSDSEGRPIRTAAVLQADGALYLRLSQIHDSRVRRRLLGTLLLLVPAVFLLDGAWSAAPVMGRLIGVAGALGVLGIVGAPADQPLVSPAVVPTRVGRLTADIVTRALESLGIAEINKVRREGGGISFPAPITRDGPGWRADVDLPYGVTVSDILDRRERLASGLRRPLGCVWPEAAEDTHAGRLVLWVGDQDMARAPAAAWPLARRGAVDVFAPVPFGSDPRGRPVTILLPENNVLIGSLPGAGKTSAVRVLMLAAALDPTCELWVFNLKGTADLDAAGKVAHRYTSGIDDQAIEAALVTLRDLRAEIVRRAAALKNLPKDLCPDGKVTRQLANHHTLGLHPLVAIIDECQNLFSHATFGKEAGELATDIIKLGRALGVILLLATQRPDAASLPTGVSSNASIRFCLRVMGQTENDMVLGTSMYKNGVRATTLRPTDKGIGYLVGATDTPVIVRTAYVDAVAAERIADRARAARTAAGTLDGYATGDTDKEITPSVSLLDDIVAVTPMPEGKVWSETITARLAALRPEVYNGWNAEQLAVALKPLGIETIQINRRIEGKVVNRRGIDRAQITAAVAERDRGRRPA